MVEENNQNLNKEIPKCPECNGDSVIKMGLSWRKRIKWSKKSGDRVRIRKYQCKSCGRVFSQEI